MLTRVKQMCQEELAIGHLNIWETGDSLRIHIPGAKANHKQTDTKDTQGDNESRVIITECMT